MGDTIWASASRTVVIGPDRPFCVIGERINPARRPRLSEALRKGDYAIALGDAEAQLRAGAHGLDINAAVAGADEAVVLTGCVAAIQDATDAPLSIDSLNVAALKQGLAVAKGRPLINSATGQGERLDPVLAMAKSRDCPLVALCLDDDGVSEDTAKRFAIAKMIVARAADHGIGKNDILVDPLVLPIARYPGSAMTTLALLRRLRDELRVNTVIGASDISFGLAERQPLTAHFLAMAIACGLTAAIMNPLQAENMAAVAAASRLAKLPAD